MLLGAPGRTTWSILTTSNKKLLGGSLRHVFAEVSDVWRLPWRELFGTAQVEHTTSQ